MKHPFTQFGVAGLQICHLGLEFRHNLYIYYVYTISYIPNDKLGNAMYIRYYTT